MQHHNDRRVPHPDDPHHDGLRAATDEGALHDSRRGTRGDRETGARRYADQLGAAIGGQVTAAARDRQARWDRSGTPLWMRIKRLLWGGHRG